MSPEEMQRARKHLAKVDPLLCEATAHLEPFPGFRPRQVDQALYRAILGQQLSVKAASSIWRKVEAHFNGEPDAHQLLASSLDELRTLGVSRRKGEYLQAVASAAVKGQLDQEEIESLDDTSVVERLTAIKGVGEWTVEMILMFGLHRPDVFSAGDLGIQQGMVALYGWELKGRQLKARMKEQALLWSPYRSFACRLLWMLREEQKGRKED